MHNDTNTGPLAEHGETPVPFVDQTYLEWPFFEDRHRRLAAELEAWCASELAAHPHDETDIDAACRRLVTALAAGGWLRYVAPAAYGGIFDELDIRSVCIIRQILAYYSGLRSEEKTSELQSLMRISYAVFCLKKKNKKK